MDNQPFRSMAAPGMHSGPGKGGVVAGTGKGEGAREQNARRPRREVLAVAAGALGVIAAESLIKSTPAQAGTDGDVVLGATNMSGDCTFITITSASNAAFVGTGAGTGSGVGGTGGSSGGNGLFGKGGASGGTGVWGEGGDSSGDGVHGLAGGPNGNGVTGLAEGDGCGVRGTGAFGIGVRGDGGALSGTGVEAYGGTPDGVGLIGYGAGFGSGVFGVGGAQSGTGVLGQPGPGNGDGVAGTLVLVDGSTGAGVHGIGNATGVGVLAENPGGGTALSVNGPSLFSRSGTVVIPSGKKTVIVTPSGGLTSSSLVLAVMQNVTGGVMVKAAVPNPGAGTFQIVLNKAPLAPATATVAWFVVN
jgi:hypothetical protein